MPPHRTHNRLGVDIGGPLTMYRHLGLLVCRLSTCRHGVWPDEVSTHLRGEKHHMTPEPAGRIHEIVQQHVREGSLAANKDEFHTITTLQEPIPDLDLFHTGTMCNVDGCRQIYMSTKALRTHQLDEHNWSPYKGKRGRPTEQVRKNRAQASEVPDGQTSIKCQQLFPSREHSGYVQVNHEATQGDPVASVNAANSPSRQSVASDPPNDGAPMDHSDWTTMCQQLVAKLNARREEAKQVIREGQDTDRKPWIDNLQLKRYIGGYKLDHLLSLMDKPDPRGEPRLYRVWTDFDQLYCLTDRNLGRYGRMIRFAANRSLATPQPCQEKPLSQYQKSSPADYTRHWKQILMFFGRTYDPNLRHSRAGSPRYQLNKKQHQSWLDLFEPPNDHDDDTPIHENEVSADTPIDDVPSMGCSVDDEVEDDEEEDDKEGTGKSMADDNSGFLETREPLSGAAYRCHQFCMSLIEQISEGHEFNLPLVSACVLLSIDGHGILSSPATFNTKLCKILKLSRMFNLEAVIERVGACCLSLLKEQMGRFMIRDSGSPVAWLVETCAYLHAVDKNTSTESQVDWEGETLRYGGFVGTMAGMRGMVHGTATEARDLCSDLGFHLELPNKPKGGWQDNPQSRELLENFITGSVDPDLLYWFREKTMTVDHIRKELSTPQGRYRWLTGFERLQELLILLILLTGGLPPRGEELLTITYRNNHETHDRGVFWLHQHVALVTNYFKGTARTGQLRTIHRYLPKEVGDILITYLWHFLPVYELLESLELSETSNTQLSSRLFPRRNGHRPGWTSRRLSESLKRLFDKHFGCRVGLRMYRQIAIAIGRKEISEKIWFDEDGDDKDGDNSGDTTGILFDAQAGHSSRIASLHYSRGIFDLDGSTASMRQRYFRLSQAWHRVLGFMVLDWDGAELSDSTVKLKQLQKRVWEKLQNAKLPALFKKFYSASAEPRPSQLKYLSPIFRGESPTLIVAPPGSGKTAAYALPALCAKETMTIVVVPVKALRDDLARRNSQCGLVAKAWSRDMPPDNANIVFVTPESIGSSEFTAFVRRAISNGRLYRIVLDEVHAVLTAGGDFRPAFNTLRDLARHGVRILMLTATLPPRREAEVWDKTGFQADEVKIHRQPTTRPDLEYSVLDLDLILASGSTIAPTVQDLSFRLIQQILAKPERGGVLIYTTTRKRADDLASKLGCLSYTGATIGRDAVEADFGANPKGILCCTPAFGLGIDKPHITDVFIEGAFFSTSDVAQAGARCRGKGSVLLVTAKELDSVVKPGQDTEGLFDLLDKGDRNRICRRVVLDRELDGRFDRSNCEHGEEHCDNCRRRLAFPAMPATPAIHIDHELGRVPDTPPPPTLQNQMFRSTSDATLNQGPTTVASGPSSLWWTSASPTTYIGTPSYSLSPATDNRFPSSLQPSSGSSHPSSSPLFTPMSSTASSPTPRRSTSEAPVRSLMTSAPGPGIGGMDRDLLGSTGSDMIRADFENQEEARERTSNRSRQHSADLQQVLDIIRQARHSWSGQCVVCFLEGGPYKHDLDSCQSKTYLGTRDARSRIKPLSYVEYTCCFVCGLPQATCSGWWLADRNSESNARSRFVKNHEAPCKARFFALNFIFGVCAARPQLRQLWARRILTMGVDINNTASLRTVLVRSRRDGFVEMNGLAVEFAWVVKMLDSLKTPGITASTPALLC